MLPKEKNIRWVGWAKPPPLSHGLPIVRPGDWYATRDGDLVYYRNLWQGGPFTRAPALGETDPDEDIYIASLAKEYLQQEAMESLKPKLMQATYIGGAAIVGVVVGYMLGRSV